MMNDIEILELHIKDNLQNIEYNKLVIYLVVNVKQDAEIKEDYKEYSITTEFFSSVELNQIVTALRKTKAKVHIIYGENQFIENVLSNKIKIDNNTLVINYAQSGVGPGRKSLIPSFCKLNNITISGSNAYVVSLCRNKYHINKLLESHNIPTPKSWLYNSSEGWLNNIKPPEGLEVIVKPIYESASIGITEKSKFIFRNQTEIIDKISKSTNQPVIVQTFIRGYEVETPVMKFGNDLLSIFPIGIRYNSHLNLDDKFLTYDDIYYDNYSFYNYEEINPSLSNEIINFAKLTFKILGIDGFGRVDFRISGNNFYITDVSTNPHLTEHGSFNFLFSTLNYTHDEIFKGLIQSTYLKL